LFLGPATYIQTDAIHEHVQSLRHDINALQDEHTICKEELENEENDDDINSLFVESSTKLLKEASDKLNEIEILKNQLHEHEAMLATFLCEEQESFKQDVVVKELHEFAKSFSKIRAEEKRQIIAKERRRKLQEEREAKSKEMEEKKKNLPKTNSGGGGGGKVNSLLDGMLHASFMMDRSKLINKRQSFSSPTERMKSRSIAMHGEFDEEVSTDDDWVDDSD
jgi:hypothetical protein